MSKKFELTTETKVVFGKTLYRIRALISFADVAVGDLGGWLEREENLSQDGEAWVTGEAWVIGEARVTGNAWVTGEARVTGKAWVTGEARVTGKAWVNGEAWVTGEARVTGKAWVNGEARVTGNARVTGKAWVTGEARVTGNAWVTGKARVYGDAWVYGNARVYGDAEILKAEHILVIGPIGSRNAFTTFYRTKSKRIEVVCGCFIGGIDKFLTAVDGTHGDNKHAKVYRAAVEIAKMQIEDVEEEKTNAAD